MKSSVQQFARELDRLCRNNIPMSQAFDMLENTAKSNMDLIVINVMRDSFNEVLLEERGGARGVIPVLSSCYPRP